ncbi:MAG: hypothetical protein RR561_06450 [Peptostreptococcus sp.]|uniref:hypothetical protein n=1 Tax=Peptostreptococcus sp. TaxID=1262 RepID=UPI002FC7B015
MYNKRIYNSFKMSQAIFILLAASAITIYTTCSLIFLNVPSYIYLNIIGIFIFSIYFGIIPSLVFIAIMQIIMIKFGLSAEFLNYSLILWVIDISIISIVKNGISKNMIKNKKVYITLVIVVSSILLSILAKPLSIGISNWITTSSRDTSSLFETQAVLEQAKIYGFSGLITLIFYQVLLLLTKTK